MTFDDGQSEHSTEGILDILKENNIKATFFQLGSSIERNHKAKYILKRIVDEVLKSMGIWQVDWNALNGDAEGKNFPKEVLLSKLKETVWNQDVVIILIHDTDYTQGTVEYLQSAIDYLNLKDLNLEH